MALKNKLIPFQDDWALKFREEAELIAKVFGESAIAIYHVGSTSIPGIYAKPEIDIHVEIKAIAGIGQYAEGMTLLGYRVRGEAVEPGSYYYSKDEEGIRTFKVHVSESNHPGLKNHLQFRDYLRAHPDRAKQYSDLKRRLAQTNKTGIMEYLDGKGPFIMETLALAAGTGLAQQNVGDNPICASGEER
jgi:GrpB-like predicted nucleotidyltransferase (UPF0157 family)